MKSELLNAYFNIWFMDFKQYLQVLELLAA